MIIRKEQLKVFSESMIENYKRRVEEHLRRSFRNECAQLTGLDIRGLIENGIVRSAKYGVVTERDVCLFIDLMFVFWPGIRYQRLGVSNPERSLAYRPNSENRLSIRRRFDKGQEAISG